jgi:hypothetical protein
MKNVVASATGTLNASLQAIAEEFKDVTVTADTPVSTLNSIISRYPVTGEPKG